MPEHHDQRPPVRRLPRRESRDLDSAPLTAEDVEAIREAFHMTCKGEVRLTTADYEFDRASDLVSVGITGFETLTVEGWDPYVFLDLRPSWTTLHLSDAEKGGALAARIEAILGAAKARIPPAERPAPTPVKKGAFMSLPPARLYLDDLEALDALFRSVLQDVTVTAAGFKFHGVDDLVRHDRPIQLPIEFEGRKPHATVEFETFGSRLYLSDVDDVQLRGMEARVRDIVEAARKRRIRPFFRSSVSLRRATDREPGFVQRNEQAIAGGVVGAVATGIVTILLIVLGILKTA